VTLAEVTRAAVALLSSCALWLVVSGDERSAIWVPVRMELSSGSGAITPPSQPVQAFVSGRRRDFLRLLQSPPTLRRTLARNVRDSLAIDSVRVQLRPIDVVLPNGTEARVTDLHPRSVVVGLTRGPRA
jgi:hypothetical protein